ncbi:MAG: tRNA (N(6)-L-threonylcarbamoyladenosine(37)-C(2))-methylthiotransferase MtaB [Clostridium sp. 27_14]|nr:MAG: tRNA (N(6)-L-threonylcarbamoyladenosine(37)-C(2))-methylthiotransferase MtaB [Clostridium sp. 27_14]
MSQKLIEEGYKIVEHTQKADIYIINTCTVTNMSDRKSRQMIRRAKEINPEATIIAVGCYVQVAKKEIENIKEIDLALGNEEKVDIVKYCNEIIQKNKKEEIADVMQSRKFAEFGETSYTEKTRAVIKVQDGCDRFCSYCIIPYARGRVRSREPEHIIKEIKQIANEGIKEVVITGIHIASYGKDFKKDYKLIDLLEEINKIDGIERIRLGSIEPLLITEEFVQRLVKLEKICEQFHLSLQSGCDETLKRMNRRYTTQQFEEIVKRLRKAYDNVNLTTDIIVGFPGETEEEFAKTYKFLEKIKFYKMHIFKYSPRKGTRAEQMPQQIEPQLKEERSKKLIELSDKNEKEYNSKYVGKRVEVLWEEQKNEIYKGHTKNYVLVEMEAKPSENKENVIESVQISQAYEHYVKV